MAFRVVGAPLVENSGAGTLTSHPISMPTGSGGGILVLYGISGNPAVTITAPTSPWVLIADNIHAGNDHQVVWWLPPGNTQSATSMTSSGLAKSEGFVFRIAGEDAWTPEIGSVSGSSTTPDPASLSPSWSGDTTWLAAATWRNGTDTITAYPANYTLAQGATYTGGASGTGLAYATRELTVAGGGSEDPGTFTIGTIARAWVGGTIGIKQVTASDTTPPAAPTGLTATVITE